MSKIENNKVARVHYTGTLPDTGKIFDSSEGREPLTFLVGHRQMIPGFERELMGLLLGKRWNLRYLQKTHMAATTQMRSKKFQRKCLEV